MNELNYKKIWCDTCGEVRKLITDYLPKAGKNNHDALDLICDYCKVIIATLHFKKSNKVPIPNLHGLTGDEP